MAAGVDKLKEYTVEDLLEHGHKEVIKVLNTMLNEWAYHPERDMHEMAKRYYRAEKETLALQEGRQNGRKKI